MWGEHVLRELAQKYLIDGSPVEEISSAPDRPVYQKRYGKDFNRYNEKQRFKGKWAEDKPHYHGHRDRLRQRFANVGKEGLADYELLELVLFRAIPYRDVKPLAKRLLSEFGDINYVIAAPHDRLIEVPGVGDAVIAELKIVEAVAHRFMQAQVLERDVISSWQALIDYCRTSMAHADTEEFRVLYLDRKNTLIADETQGKGTVDHVPVYPREIVKRALHHNASAVILVHNHPSGDPTPSDEDLQTTQYIQSALSAVGVTLHDHLIIGKSRETSFRGEGLLD